jgi:hypothetical protein
MSFWNHDHPRQEEYQRLWDELVPDSGPCETLEGETLRASSRIYRDYYNNGFGNNWSGALTFLDEHMGMPRRIRDLLAPYARGQIREHGGGQYGLHDPMVPALEELAELAVDAAGHLPRRPSPCDMLSLSEPDDFGQYDEEDE